MAEDAESVEEESEEVSEEPVEEVAEDTSQEEEAESSEKPSLSEEPEQKTVSEEPKKPMVPKSRLDEVLQKQKALQKQLDDLKATQKPAEEAPEEYDFGAKEVEYQNLLLDGEAEKAAALRAEKRKSERTQI